MTEIKNNLFMPYVWEQTGHGERGSDIFSRLLKDRIVILGAEVTDEMASLLIAQLLFLQSEDSKKDIDLYINSPGGSVTAGLAIYDTMQMLSCDVRTYCIGQAASMGAVLLAAGAPGKRYALPHSRIMVHQPSYGYSGTAADMEIHTQELLKIRKMLYEILSHHCGKTAEEIYEKSSRDHFMGAEEAMADGLIDKILYPAKK